MACGDMPALVRADRAPRPVDQLQVIIEGKGDGPGGLSGGVEQH
jgi:hypothetical protein